MGAHRLPLDICGETEGARFSLKVTVWGLRGGGSGAKPGIEREAGDQGHFLRDLLGRVWRCPGFAEEVPVKVVHDGRDGRITGDQLRDRLG